MDRSAAKNSLAARQSAGGGEAFDFDAFAAQHGATTSQVKAGTDVYLQGDRADCLYHIRKGEVQIKVASPHGKEAIMAILDADTFFGETCLLGETVRVATATCFADSVLVRMGKENAVRAMQDIRFAEFLLARTLRRVGRLRARLISQIFDTSEQRLARILLMLANYGKGNRRETVIEKLGQEELAQMVGTTRARISYFMNRFRKQGYIDYNGQIAVYRSLSNVLPSGFGNPEDYLPAFESL